MTPSAPRSTRRGTTGARHRISTAVGTLGAPAVIAVTAALVVRGWRPELPDPVATRWGPDGVAGTASVDTALLALLVPVAVVAVLAWALATFRGGQSMTRRLANATATWTAVFVAGVVLATIGVQRGLTDARLAPDVDAPLALAFLAACVAAAAAAWLTPGDPPTPTTAPLPTDADRLPIASREQAAWVQRVRTGSPAVLGLAVVAFCAALGVATGQWVFPAVLAILLAALLLTMLRWTVTVDRHGLTARSALPRPSVHIPLSEVEHAEVVHVDPFREFGGWGLRTGLDGRTGVVLRAGDALQVHRSGGRMVVVTVPDAATGAALLNTLAARTR